MTFSDAFDNPSMEELDHLTRWVYVAIAFPFLVTFGVLGLILLSLLGGI